MMFGISFICLCVITGAMLIMLLLMVFAGLCNLCDSLTDDEAMLIWEAMKACAVVAGCAIGLLVLSWLIYGVVLIILTL